jgi:histidine triad (HIT) family protein
VGMRIESCLFCKIAKGEAKSEKVGESDNFLAFKDINQRIEGNTLVIPKKHFVTLLDIPNKLGSEMLKFVKEIAGKLMDEKFGDGFNLIMNNTEVAGQVIGHAHVHVIPRKEDDGVKVIE